MPFPKKKSVKGNPFKNMMAKKASGKGKVMSPGGKGGSMKKVKGKAY